VDEIVGEKLNSSDLAKRIEEVEMMIEVLTTRKLKVMDGAIEKVEWHAAGEKKKVGLDVYLQVIGSGVFIIGFSNFMGLFDFVKNIPIAYLIA
jgi:hypothetical protein